MLSYEFNLPHVKRYLISFFFSILVFFHEHSRFTPLYHFHPLHRHLDISWAITAESSPLHIASSRTQTGNLWSLTTKLRALKVNFAHELYQELPENLSLAFDANPSLEVRAFCLDISKVFDRV